MSTYSEHAAEAERLIVLASIQPDTDSSQAVTDAAQVHAMLALAEQQRIANLIALSTANDDEMIDLLQAEARSVLVRWVPTGADDEHQEIRPDIADALGIRTGDIE